MRKLLLALSVLTFGSLLQAADWPQWRGVDGDGISSESLPEAPGFENVLWRKKVGIGFSSVAVSEGRVFTMGHAGSSETVWCFDEETGDEIWTDSYPAPLIDRFYEGGPGATPTVRGGRVYTYSKHGRLRCYEAATGKLFWKRDMMAEAELPRPPEWGFACSPYFASDNMLLIEAGPTFALDPESGKILWKGESFTPAYGTPMALDIGERQFVAVMKTEGLVVFDSADGKTVSMAKWETSFNTSATTPIVDGNRIFISTGYDRGCALFELNARSGELRKLYENTSMCNHMNNCVLIKGHLYGFDGTAHRGRPTEFVCMEFSTGEEKWRVPRGEGLGCGSVMAAGDGRDLVILTERGELISAPATPEGFEIASRAQVLGGRCWTVPVLSGGRIYGRNAAGDLVCLQAD